MKTLITILGLMAFSLSVNAQTKKKTKERYFDTNIEILLSDGQLRTFNNSSTVRDGTSLSFDYLRKEAINYVKPCTIKTFRIISMKEVKSKKELSNSVSKKFDCTPYRPISGGLYGADSSTVLSIWRNPSFIINTKSGLMKFDDNGDIFYQGRKLTSDTAIVNGFKRMLNIKVN